MSYVRHKFKAMMELDPKQAKTHLLVAFRKTGAHYGDTAKLLGCSQQTLALWVEELGLKTTLEALVAKAKKEQWWHGRWGGRGYHQDPVESSKRMWRTRKAKVKEKAA